MYLCYLFQFCLLSTIRTGCGLSTINKDDGDDADADDSSCE